MIQEVCRGDREGLWEERSRGDKSKQSLMHKGLDSPRRQGRVCSR